MCVCIYIYIEREREIDTCIHDRRLVRGPGRGPAGLQALAVE